MDLMDLLKATGGDNGLGQIADKLGLGSDDTSKLIGALAPALMGGLAKQSGSGLRRALQSGDHGRYIDNPALLADDATRQDGNGILGHIFGSKDVSRRVATEAQGSTGIDASLIKKALPLLAALAMGAMSKKTEAGRSGGGLGDLIGFARKFF